MDFGGGPITASDTSASIFVVEHSATGAHLWSKGIGGTGEDYGRGIAFDRSGNVVVSGSSFMVSPDQLGKFWLRGDDQCRRRRYLRGEVFARRLVPVGKAIRRWIGTAAQAVATDTNGNILLTGTY